MRDLFCRYQQELIPPTSTKTHSSVSSMDSEINKLKSLIWRHFRIMISGLDLKYLQQFNRSQSNNSLWQSERCINLLHIAINITLLPSHDLEFTAGFKQNCLSFIHSFVGMFASVQEYMKSEKIFRKSAQQCSQMITLISKSIHTNDDCQHVLLKLVRIFSRNAKLGNDIVVMIDIIASNLTTNHHSINPHLITECVAILANTASIPAMRSEMIKYGCIQSIINHMDKLRHHEKVEIEICAALSNLALFEDTCRLIVDGGGAQKLISILNSLETSVELCVQCFHVITNMGKHLKDKIDSIILISTIYKIVSSNEHEYDLVMGGVNAIGALAFAKYSFGDLGGRITEQICRLMKSFSRSSTLQFSCAFCMAHMGYINVLDRQFLLRTRGIELIFTAMKSFPFDVNLQTTCCFAIVSLTANDDLMRAQVLQCGGIDCILNVMKTNFTKIGGGTQSGSSSGQGMKIFSSFHIENSNQDTEGLVFEAETASIESAEEESHLNQEEDLESNQEAPVELVTADESLSSSYSSLVNRFRAESAEENDIDIGDVESVPSQQITTREATDNETSLHKDMLLQVFSSVALLNLADHEQCKLEMIRRGVIVRLFYASQKLKGIKSLRFILANVFMRFTSLTAPAAYVKQNTTKVPSLRELCQMRVLEEASAEAEESSGLHKNFQSWLSRLPLWQMLNTFVGKSQPSINVDEYENEGGDSPKCPDNSNMDVISGQKQQQPRRSMQARITNELPVNLKRQLSACASQCDTCKRSRCFPSTTINLYHLSVLKSKHSKFCSETCAQRFKHEDPLIRLMPVEVQLID